jgi:hypothetical protein
MPPVPCPERAASEMIFANVFSRSPTPRESLEALPFVGGIEALWETAMSCESWGCTL